MDKEQKRIYLDYAATTPVDEKILKAMLPYFHDHFGNPGSVHFIGDEARIAVEKARQKIADFLNCAPEEVIFTGSATEADNLTIKGLVFNFLSQINILTKRKKAHIITSSIEHKAVLKPCHWLEERGLAGVTYLPINKQGIVQISDVKKAIKDNTVLVSIMYANNEIGTIQPIAKIGQLIEKINKSRDKKTGKIYFHTDAVQAVNYFDCNVEKLGVDMLTLSGHKIYGPKGVGALYIRKGVVLEPQILGGGQERGMRASTENTAAIIGLGEAVNQAQKTQNKESKRIKILRNKLIDGILKNIQNTRLNGSREKRLPNNVNISFKGVEGEAVLVALDQQGVCISTGSACAAKGLIASHVLMALTNSEETAHSSLRFSLGKYTTKKEIDYVLKVLPGIIKKLRQISGHNPKTATCILKK